MWFAGGTPPWQQLTPISNSAIAPLSNAVFELTSSHQKCNPYHCLSERYNDMSRNYAF